MADEHDDSEAGAGRLDLTVIEGLGTESAKILHRAGIHGIAELSDFQDATQLHEYLHSRGVKIPLERIMNRRGRTGNWVAQARRHHARTWAVDFAADRGTEPPTWTTTVSSDELGIEQRFAGTDPAGWAGWILERSVLSAPDETQQEGEQPSAIDGDDGGPSATNGLGGAFNKSDLEVVIVDVVEPEAGHRGDQLETHVEVRLSGSGAGGLAAREPYCWLEVLAVGEDSGKPFVLGSTLERIPRGVSSHTATLTCAAPDFGRYRLFTLTYCFVPDLRVAWAEGPQLTVIERAPRAS